MHRSVVGFSGNITRPSKTRGFVEHIVANVADRVSASAQVFDIEDLGPSLLTARWSRDLSSPASDILRQVVDADVLVVGSPTYKGSYTGLFKHFFDLVDPAALRGKPIVLTATGGGDRHSLIVEHQLRPLFGFFEAFALPTAIYASDADFEAGRLKSDLIKARAARVVGEVAVLLDARTPLAAVAAE